MKFVVQRKQFLDAIKVVQPAVGKRTTLPILSGVRLCASDNVVAIEATDLEMAIATSVDAKVVASGTAVIPAAAIVKAMRSFDASEIEIASEDDGGRARISIHAGTRTVAVQGHAVEDWPRTRIDPSSKPAATVEARALADAFGRVSLCVSSDEARPVLTGVALTIDRKAKAMDVVATDSYRLGVMRVTLSQVGTVEQPPIIPARAVRAIAKQLKNARGVAQVHVESDEHVGTVVVGYRSIVWSMRAIDGQFPDWRQILADEGGTTLEFEADEMASALKTMAAVRSNGTPVRLSLGKRCMLALSEKDIGEVTETLGAATYTADGVGEIEVGFNLDYLADAIRFIGAERTEARIRDALKPAIFAHADRRYALMPVRLS